MHSERDCWNMCRMIVMIVINQFSVSIISGVGPTSLQLGLFFHQTRHRTRMQARDELSCMHKVGLRPSHRGNITSHRPQHHRSRYNNSLVFIIQNALQHSSSRGGSHCRHQPSASRPQAHHSAEIVRLPPTVLTCVITQWCEIM